MIQKIAASALVALALGGCAILHPEEKLPPAPQAQGVELTKEQGGRFIAFVGPRLQHTEMFLGVTDTNYFALRSWLDNKTGEVAHQLYVEDSYYGGPYLWNGARDADNKPLRFIAISRNEITCDLGCAYADEFAAELPDAYLRAPRQGRAVGHLHRLGRQDAAGDRAAKPGDRGAHGGRRDPHRARGERAEGRASREARDGSAGAAGLAPGTVVPAPKPN